MVSKLLVSLSGACVFNPDHVTPDGERLLNGIDPMISPQEAAAALGMSHATFYRLARSEIPSVTVGKKVRFRLSDVIAFFERKTADSVHAD